MRFLSSVALVALSVPVDALACGGFFCNQEFPIDQAAEQIVFGVDDETGDTTVHVGITYQGASEDFAWVVPVPAVPRLGVSSDALFTALNSMTRPQFFLQTERTGVCELSVSFCPGCASDQFDADSDTGGVDDDRGGVSVVAEQQVGPYDTVTLQAESTDELLAWLNAAGYDLPSNLAPALAPYVAGGQYFVALKLSAGNDTGDLEPLAMTYAATAASVPIQLTSIAATPDMRLEVYVLGDHRAVPENYLHVTINEAAIDWLNAGSNYNDVITLAADEAGGHAFATDFSGSTERLRGSLWNDAQFDLDSLRTVDDPIAWVQGLMNLGFPPSAALLELLEELIPFPQALADQGLRPQDFYNCLDCYAEYVDATGFSGAEATDALEADVIAGLREAELLFASFDHVTRLTSSLDAVEMTVDPMFVFNDDIAQDVSNVHGATMVYHCGFYEGWTNAERTLRLSDGREIRIPSEAWMAAHNMTLPELLGDVGTPAAVTIEDLGSTGEGQMLFDFRAEAADRARQFGRPGGCQTGGAEGGAIAVGLLALALRRRRSDR